MERIKDGDWEYEFDGEHIKIVKAPDSQYLNKVVKPGSKSWTEIVTKFKLQPETRMEGAEVTLPTTEMEGAVLNAPSKGQPKMAMGKDDTSFTEPYRAAMGEKGLTPRKDMESLRNRAVSRAFGEEAQSQLRGGPAKLSPQDADQIAHSVTEPYMEIMKQIESLGAGAKAKFAEFLSGGASAPKPGTGKVTVEQASMPKK